MRAWPRCTAIALALCAGACSRAPSPDDFAKLRKDHAAYTLAANVAEGRLTVSAPDGKVSGIRAEDLTRVYLYRLNKADSSFGADGYFWFLEGGATSLQVPYFAASPARFAEALARVAPQVRLADLDARTREFEANKFNLCTLWAAPGTEPMKAVPPYTACER